MYLWHKQIQLYPLEGISFTVVGGSRGENSLVLHLAVLLTQLLGGVYSNLKLSEIPLFICCKS